MSKYRENYVEGRRNASGELSLQYKMVSTKELNYIPTDEEFIAIHGFQRGYPQVYFSRPYNCFNLHGYCYKDNPQFISNHPNYPGPLHEYMKHF